MAGLVPFLHQYRYYLFMTFYDERVPDVCSGRPLFQEALRFSFSRGDIREVSFVGRYPFAMSWCDQVREYQKVRTYGPGLRGQVAEAPDRWRRRSVSKVTGNGEHA